MQSCIANLPLLFLFAEPVEGYDELDRQFDESLIVVVVDLSDGEQLGSGGSGSVV